MQVVTEHRIRHLPVVDGGHRASAWSRSAIWSSAVIEDQRQELDHLQRYIAS
jgi:hypothetical protein